MPIIPLIIGSLLVVGIYQAFKAATKPGTDEEDIKQKEIVLDDVEDILKERSFDWGEITHDTN